MKTLDSLKGLHSGVVIALEEDMLRLIAGNYEGSYWVKLVSRLKVE